MEKTFHAAKTGIVSFYITAGIALRFSHKMLKKLRQFLQFGKIFPKLTNLVRINTPKAMRTETRKAFCKLPNVEQAISTLTNLKGVGTTLASGLSSASNLLS